MRCIYFDCFSGAAGDMILAALVDAGCPIEVLRDTVARLGLEGVSLETERVKRHGIAALRARVEIGDQARRHHRHLPQILEMIAGAELPGWVSERATLIFRRLAEAEAVVHGTTVERIHFHEVGAADAIVDIVGACAGLHALEVAHVLCSPIPVGSGTLTCEHGVMPVPAPATAELLRGVPLAACDEPGELTTPTGAAILTTLATDFTAPPPITIDRVGYGAGTREGDTRANILRVILGIPAADDACEQDVVTVLEAQVDDATGQALAFALEQVFEAGALDAFIVPIIMKKGRPGQLLTVLCRQADVAVLESAIFAHTPTLGVRRRESRRTKLSRRRVAVETPYGTVHVKVACRGEDTTKAWPEYEDCAAQARAHGVTLSEVQQTALAAWRRLDKS